MQTIPEQISSATRAPIEAQLELFGSIAMAAVENTGRLALLQIDASRTAVEQACEAWRHLLAGAQNLAAPTPRCAAEEAGRPDIAQPDQSPPTLREIGAASRPDDQAGAGRDQAPVPELVADPHAAEPPVHRTPIAEAAAQVVPDARPGVPIVAAPAPADNPVTLPKLKPVEAAPPPSHSQGIGQRKGVPRK